MCHHRLSSLMNPGMTLQRIARRLIELLTLSAALLIAGSAMALSASDRQGGGDEKLPPRQLPVKPPTHVPPPSTPTPGPAATVDALPAGDYTFTAQVKDHVFEAPMRVRRDGARVIAQVEGGDALTGTLSPEGRLTLSFPQPGAVLSLQAVPSGGVARGTMTYTVGTKRASGDFSLVSDASLHARKVKQQSCNAVCQAVARSIAADMARIISVIRFP